MKFTSAKFPELLVVFSILLASIGQYSHAAAASESPSKLKPFRVDAFEKVVLPNAADPYLGKVARIKADRSEVMRVQLGYKFLAKTDSDIQAVVGGIPQSMPAGSLLTQRRASGGRIKELPADALILCRAPVQRDFGQTMAAAVTLGVTQLAARYAADIQLCAIDADRDGKLEKLFLGGAKQQGDLEFTSIDPTPYTYKENYPVDEIQLVLYASKSLFGPQLVVALEENRIRRDFSYLRFNINGKMSDHRIYTPIRANKLPQEFKFGSAVILLKGYEQSSETIDIEFVKDFEIQTVDWYFAPQTIYIYM